MKQKKINILFLCSWYPNPEAHSNGIFIKRHAEALALQHNVTVLFVKSVHVLEFASVENEEGNLKEILFYYPKTKNNIPIISSIIKFFKFKKYYKNQINLLDNAYDVIHVNTIFPAAIPALYAIKKYPKATLFITEHWSGYYPEDGNYKGLITTYFTKKLIAKAKAIFVISSKLKNAMHSHKLLGNYELINNVVNTSVFKPLHEIEKINNDVLKILHVSSLVDREKNITGIIKIAHELVKKQKSFHLTIVGENSCEIKAYKENIDTLNLQQHITFVGYKKPTEICKYMNEADVFLLFSNYEGMPVVILEAIACGLPVITTNIGEVKNMIPENMGIILNENTVKECAENLTSFNPKQFLSQTIMNEYIANKYGPQAICNDITTLYNKYQC